MSFLLDTDICSAYLKNPRTVFSRFVQHAGQLHVSALTIGELYTWVLRSTAPASHRRGLEDLLANTAVLPVENSVAKRFGEIRSQLLDQGRSLPAIDLFIAATALVHDLTVVTHNVSHFAGVPSLKVADWLSA